VGGYAALLTLVVPALARDQGEALGRLALAACRFLSAAGTLTILAGAVFIPAPAATARCSAASGAGS
jgi:hypothetical protein